MSEEDPSGEFDEDDFVVERHKSRASLLWAVFVFQAKLVVDGFRDLILVPVSLVAALLGLLAGGNEPDKYFHKVLRLGRRSEIWINLFGHRKHRGTSDAIIDPIKERMLKESQQRPWVQKAEKNLNQTLDKVNERIESAVSSRDKD
jgi:hypothetical protein